MDRDNEMRGGDVVWIGRWMLEVEDVGDGGREDVGMEER